MENKKEIINKMADTIKKDIKDGSLFGAKIDMENVNEVLVATRLFYEDKTMKEYYKW